MIVHSVYPVMQTGADLNFSLIKEEIPDYSNELVMYADEIIEKLIQIEALLILLSVSDDLPGNTLSGAAQAMINIVSDIRELYNSQWGIVSEIIRNSND